MIYPGDVYFFVLPLMQGDGTSPTLAMAPLITILNLQTRAAVISPSPSMVLQNGLPGTYVYGWNTSGLPNGTYLAAVTYALNGVVFTNQVIETVRLGDSMIVSQVAQEATVAKDLTVAKDATVMHASQYTYNDPGPTLTAILAALSGVATQTQLAAVASQLQDVYDATTGTWVVDKVANTLTMRRGGPAGAAIASFNLINTSTQSSRQLITD